MVKRITKYFLRIIGVILIPIVVYLLAAIILSFLSTSPEALNCQPNREIYITSNGIHLDIILPTELVNERLANALERSQQVKYLAFGWGDKGFYLKTPTWDQLKLSVAFNAMFMKSETAMHVTYLDQRLNSWNSLKLCDSQIDQLQAYIMGSFKSNTDGKMIEIAGSGYTADDTFFEANGSYSLFKTCNNWVNIGLKRSQIKTAIWSPFDLGVLYQIRRNPK